LAMGYYGQPADEMTVIAVTGTNGKTTVTRWLAQALTVLGKKAAVIGTLGYGAPDALKPHSGLTTPDVVGVHQLLHALRRDGFEAVCLEASSIGLEQRRLAGVSIDLALFTNLSQDHLDYHGSMQAYGQSKLILASWPTLRAAVVNVDDTFGKEFQAVVESRNIQCVTVGQDSFSNCQLLEVQYCAQGMTVQMNWAGQRHACVSSAIGHFNAENLALVFACLGHMGYGAQVVLDALVGVTPPAGRMQVVANKPCVVVDYAHTPDALQKALQTLQPLAKSRAGRLVVVFGCGGDRDRSKRPVMGQIAAQCADHVVLTSDNPRSEDPVQILKEIQAGIQAEHLTRLAVEVDRVKAIELALNTAKDSDVVLIAGKGHEETQTIGDKVLVHSDAACAQAVLGRRGAHA
jgi:UDP-N-acetylmuramyl-tripeptide synthetase